MIQVPAPEAVEWDRFEVVELARGFDRPLELAVAPDGRVFTIELGGSLKVWRPETHELTEVARLEVFDEQENGLLGLALDPDFARNGWLYLLHSPRDFSGQHLSRFTLEGERLVPGSQRVLLAFEEQRVECCHHAGSLAFGPDGCLFIATGDNTNPFGDSEGYAPIDLREGRAAFDALDGSANPFSLTGKILRVRPTAAGGYEIPDGNLFPPDGRAGRPEVYVMGCRNPWRIAVDAASGFLYWGEVGPDAGADGPRGPKGHDELNQARAAGNFGWPMFVADNKPYARYDHATQAVGPLFDAARPLNPLPALGGAHALPPAQPAWIHYPYDGSPEFPELDGPGGRTACAGPVYHFDEALASPTKFPAALDGQLFVYEWSRHWIQTVALGPAGERGKITRFLPETRFVRPVDLAFGPEGALYLLEYGTTWGTNADSRLVRIDHHAGNRAPRARIHASATAGRAPFRVQLASESGDPDGDALVERWTLAREGDAPLGFTPDAPLELALDGNYTVELVVTDPSGAHARAALPVQVGNSPPELAFDRPTPAGFFDPLRPLEVHALLADLEDDAVEGPDSVAAQLARASITARFVAGPPDAGSTTPDAPGLARMKQSDCFNCHAREHRLVGPSLLEIAARLEADPAPDAARRAAVQRVRAGSTGAWGAAAMLPHPQHSEDELAAMVAWIAAQRADATPLTVLTGVGGLLEPLARPGEPVPSGTWLLEASYRDGGAGPIGPLPAFARLHVRTLTVEAEHASAHHGLTFLESSSASGGRFAGAIDHGHWLRFSDVALDGLASVALRVSSAGAGAEVVLRSGAPDGAELARTRVTPNGAWEDWYELPVPLAAAGRHDLHVVFENPGHGGLMNLDALRFVPRTVQAR